MTILLASVVAAAIAGDGTAIALDDGTVWQVADGHADLIGACVDGEVVLLDEDDDGVAIECGDGARWSWSDRDGWQPASDGDDMVSGAPDDGVASAWWPTVDVVMEARRDPSRARWQGLFRMRWDL